MQFLAAIVAALALAVIVLAIVTRSDTAPQVGPPDVAPAPLDEDSTRALLLRGRKIEAIKAYRELHRIGLKEAKEAVERLAEQLPPRR
jgi:ribosomal protein L7/L12